MNDLIPPSPLDPNGYLAKRLKEPSTWIGAVVTALPQVLNLLVSFQAIDITAAQITAITTLISSAGAFLMAMPDTQHPTDGSETNPPQ